MADFDVAIIGAGIAGVGLAADIGAHRRTVILEAEEQPGYHSTGRSAAFWSETYGGPSIQPLTSASGPVLQSGGYLQPLGAVQIGREEDRAQRDAFIARFAGAVELTAINPATRIPGLKPEWVVGVDEGSCAYIDVGGVLGEALSRARKADVEVRTRSRVTSLRRQGGVWHIETASGGVTAAVIVNAAGAWADDVARMAGAESQGIQPYRRTIVQLRMARPLPARLPHVSDFGGTFYFKPEGEERIWLCPHDETPMAACDVAPEELDVAIAIDRFEHVVDWRIAAVERKWAGLRSFAPDRLPVYGFAPECPGFFWCAGQGGFGIQTAPAAAALAASLLLDEAPATFVEHIDPKRYSPNRQTR